MIGKASSKTGSHCPKLYTLLPSDSIDEGAATLAVDIMISFAVPKASAENSHRILKYYHQQTNMFCYH